MLQLCELCTVHIIWSLVKLNFLVVGLLVNWVKYPDIMFLVGIWLQILFLIMRILMGNLVIVPKY